MMFMGSALCAAKHPEKMKNYIVQYRVAQNGPIIYLMNCYAKSKTHAIAQGARALINGDDDVCEVIATETAVL